MKYYYIQDEKSGLFVHRFGSKNKLYHLPKLSNPWQKPYKFSLGDAKHVIANYDQYVELHDTVKPAFKLVRESKL